jgi:hypothetical protein
MKEYATIIFPPKQIFLEGTSADTYSYLTLVNYK